MIAVGSRAMLHVRIRSNRQTMSSADATILVGLMLLPGSWLILCTLVAVAAAKASARIALKKLVFNTAKDVVVAASAVAVTRLLHHEGPFTADIRSLPVILAAAAVTAAVVVPAAPAAADPQLPPLTVLTDAAGAGHGDIFIISSRTSA